MDTAFLGEIHMFAGDYAPPGYAFCDGSLISIWQNPALFSLIGNVYGGDGIRTFALPDLRGLAVRGTGTGPGFGPVQLGQQDGSVTHSLTEAELPSHLHEINVTNDVATVPNPKSAIFATQTATIGPLYDFPHDVAPMSPACIPLEGSVQSQPHDNMQPYLVISYIIAVDGIFPPPDWD